MARKKYPTKSPLAEGPIPWEIKVRYYWPAIRATETFPSYQKKLAVIEWSEEDIEYYKDTRYRYDLLCAEIYSMPENKLSTLPDDLKEWMLYLRETNTESNLSAVGQTAGADKQDTKRVSSEQVFIAVEDRKASLEASIAETRAKTSLFSREAHHASLAETAANLRDNVLSLTDCIKQSTRKINMEGNIINGGSIQYFIEGREPKSTILKRIDAAIAVYLFGHFIFHFPQFKFRDWKDLDLKSNIEKLKGIADALSTLSDSDVYDDIVFCPGCNILEERGWDVDGKLKFKGDTGYKNPYGSF